MNEIDIAQIANLVSVSTLTTFLLVLFRCLGVFMLAPILGNRAIPPMFQVAISFMLALLVFPQVRFQDSLATTSDLYLLQLIFKEVTIGVVIGFVAMMILAAIQAAGEIVGVKVGFSIASVIDPNMEGMSSVLSQYYFVFGALIFLHLDGHHLIIESLVHSFRLMPLGAPLSTAFAGSMGGLVAELLVVAIKLAAPVIIVITLLNLSFGLLSKISPQLNIFFNIGFIVGPILGGAVILASLPLMRILITQLTEEMRPEIFQMIRMMKGV